MKKILSVILVLLLVLITGCSMISSAAPVTPGPKIVKKAEIASRWQMYQLTVDIGPGMELPIALRLAEGDRVDGYWYVEKGGRIDFNIKGNTLMYQSENPANGKASSDRFAFVASAAQGMTYTLTWRNNGDPTKKEKTSIFIELIYPLTGAIFTPLEAK